MPGLCLEARAALCAELDRRALDQPRMPDGSRAMILTPADARVFRALALDFHNGATGRTDPGFRAIKAKANVALGTVSNSTRRLRAAGWIAWHRVPRRVHGSMRLCRVYTLAPEAPGLRSRFGPKPMEVSRGLVDKAGPQPPAMSVARQIAAASAWHEEYVLQKAPKSPSEISGAFGMFPCVARRT